MGSDSLIYADLIENFSLGWMRGQCSYARHFSFFGRFGEQT
jgi:hypothetical protein